MHVTKYRLSIFEFIEGVLTGLLLLQVVMGHCFKMILIDVVSTSSISCDNCKGLVVRVDTLGPVEAGNYLL